MSQPVEVRVDARRCVDAIGLHVYTFLFLCYAHVLHFLVSSQAFRGVAQSFWSVNAAKKIISFELFVNFSKLGGFVELF